MSTIKVNEVRHLSNVSTANITLANTGATTLQDATAVNLTATSVTVSGTTTLNGNSVVGNASTDTCTLTATTKGQYMYAGFTGEIRMWSSASAPTTWLVCDGGTIGNNSSGATYKPNNTGVSTLQPLFDHLKTSFGNTGNESYTNNDTVKLPDFKGRIGIGVGQQTNVKWKSASSNYTNSGTNFALGGTGGAEDHALLLAESPTHNHTGTVDSQTTGVTVATTLSLSTVVVVGNHTHTITDPEHSHAHTHDFSHTHSSDSDSATLANSTKSLAHTHAGPSHQHEFWGDDAAGQYGGFTQIQDNNYDAESEIKDSWNQGGRYYTSAAGTGATGAMSANESHTHTISGKVGTPIDFNGNANITTGSATAHAQATGITVNATTNSTKPSVSVTLKNADASGNPSATSTVTDTGHQHAFTTSSKGSDGAHNNLQPYIGIYYIIKI